MSQYLLVDKDCIHATPEKVKAFQNNTNLKTVDNVRSHLELAGYYSIFHSGFCFHRISTHASFQEKKMFLFIGMTLNNAVLNFLKPFSLMHPSWLSQTTTYHSQFAQILLPRIWAQSLCSKSNLVSRTLNAAL